CGRSAHGEPGNAGDPAVLDNRTISIARPTQDGRIMLPIPHTRPRTAHQPPEVVIELGALRPALLRAARLFLETVLVPTALLFVLLHTVGLVAGLSAVLGWCVLTVAIRWISGRHLPGTLLLCAGMLCARATIALVLSSALVYLLQP